MARIGSSVLFATVEGLAQYFTGRVTIRGQFSRDEPSRVTGAIVTFQPGARTAWHSHPLGQTLIVTDGVGWTLGRDSRVIAGAGMLSTSTAQAR